MSKRANLAEMKPGALWLAFALFFLAGCAAPEREEAVTPAPNLPSASQIVEFRVTTDLFLDKEKSSAPHETFIVPESLTPQFLETLRGRLAEIPEKKWPLIAEINLTLYSGPAVSLWLFYTGEGTGAYRIFFRMRGGKMQVFDCRGGDEKRWIELMKQAREEENLAEEKKAEEMRKATGKVKK
jgi:hypothetical protein